jgi:hypothetical protein
MPEIELLNPHTHAGVAHPAGTRLTVTERQAAWLLKLGVARMPAPVPEPELAPEPAPEPARSRAKARSTPLITDH